VFKTLLLRQIAFHAFDVVREDEFAVGSRFFLWDAHAVEGAIDEDEGDDEEERADASFQVLIFHGHGDFHREQAEQRGEFDHGVQRDG